MDPTYGQHWTGRAELAIAAFTLIVWWGVVLPHLSRQPQIQAAQQWVEAERLDVSAMFYSELPAVDESLARMRSLRRRDNQVLWGTGSTSTSR